MWQGDPDSRLRLQAEGDGYRLESLDALDIEHYDAQGQLTSRTEAGGLITQYGYDSEGRLAAVTGPFGRTLAFSYDSNNRIEGIATPDGQLTYAYDAQGNLTEVNYPDGNSRRYHYEESALPHHLTDLTDERGERLATWRYQRRRQGDQFRTQRRRGAG
ncbi:MAG: hypothetical protein KZQ65_11285 [Candidatus Thiodiazotropha sp. (ex Gloverina cf. vestifex)]|nr:hypothetical protein [Candidatus Thiodiazotropha sp. (ex Gloverina cf. vestifex)]